MEEIFFRGLSVILLPLLGTALKSYMEISGAKRSYIAKYKNRNYFDLFYSILMSLSIIFIFAGVHLGIVLISENYIGNFFDAFVYGVGLIPIIIVFSIVYLNKKSGKDVNQGYIFVAIVITFHFITGGFFLLFCVYLFQESIVLHNVILNGILLSPSAIGSIWLMELMLNNEILSYRYIVRYDGNQIISSNYIVDNGEEILINRENNNQKLEFLIELPKSKIDSINIIKTKKKIYGRKSETAPNTTVSDIPT